MNATQEVKTFTVDGYEFIESNRRMKYNPDIHYNHRKPFTTKELAYICFFYEDMNKADMSVSLGRTHGTILAKAHELRQSGEFDYYKSLGRKML